METLLSIIIKLVGVPAAYSADAADGVDRLKKYWSIFGDGAGGSNLLIAFAERVAEMVFLLIGGISVIGVLQGAIKIVTSGGNDEGRNKGKTMIISALIGVGLAVLGTALVAFVKTFLVSLGQ